MSDLRKDIVNALDGIKVIRLTYKENHWKPVWSDDERYIDGWNEEDEHLLTKDFLTQEDCDEYVCQLSVTEGESEGMVSFKIVSEEAVWKPKFENEKGS